MSAPLANSATEPQAWVSPVYITLPLTEAIR